MQKVKVLRFRVQKVKSVKGYVTRSWYLSSLPIYF